MNGSVAIPRWQRWLLPAVEGSEGAQRDGAALPRSPRDWAVDVALFAFAVLTGALVFAADQRLVGRTLWLIDGTAAIVPCLALWARRRHPLAVGWLAVVLSGFSGASTGAALVGLFTVAVHRQLRRTLELALMTAVSGVAYLLIYDGGHDAVAHLALGLVLTVAVIAFGLYVRARRELVLSLHDRAQRAEDEQHRRVREAQLAERARIAREMHDVLAHRISLLSVHAGALEFNPDAAPEEIARAAGVIRVSAREAQEELREVIGVLRTGAEAGDAEAEGAEPPQPTLADLTTLIGESRVGGMDVSVTNALQGETLPPILGRTVYRVIQEALTNVRKHAPGQVVTIAIERSGGDGVRVEVVNRPRVAHAAEDGATDHVGSGMGLVGLAERVLLVGGQLSTAPLPGGGFRLVATMPWSNG